VDHPMHPPGQDPPSLRRARILRERAERLAREEPPAPEGALLDVVAFPLGGEPFAVGALHVGEVLPLRGVTPLPGTPPFVAGILNLRGTLVSLVDLRVLLHMPREEEARMGVILRGKGMEFGLVTEGLLGTRRVPVEQIRPAPPGTGDPWGLILGIWEDLILLDGARLLAEPSLVVDDAPDPGGNTTTRREGEKGR